MEQQAAAGSDAAQRQRGPALIGPLAFGFALAAAECAWSGAVLALQGPVSVWLAGHAVVMLTAGARFLAL
ncbi:hypothetical protein ABTL50_19815, partial [Acinetobacter baumannii]